jgi:hypothetical protein
MRLRRRLCCTLAHERVTGSLECAPRKAAVAAFRIAPRSDPLTREGLTFTISHLQIMTKSGATELLRQVGEPRPRGI